MSDAVGSVVVLDGDPNSSADQTITPVGKSPTLFASVITENAAVGFDGQIAGGTVIVFDDHPDPVSTIDPNGSDRYNFPVTVTTGPRGIEGPTGPIGPMGPTGPVGDVNDPDMPDLTTLFENGLV